MRKIVLCDWCWWEIDEDKTVKAYDNNLVFIGWLYFKDNLILLLNK